MTRSRLRRAAAVASAGVLLMLGWSISSQPVGDAPRDASMARRADFVIRVDAMGALEAARALTFTSAMRGDKGKLLQIAEDGARVQEGDLLVAFDSTLLDSELLRLTGELRSREAVTAYVRQALEVEKSRIEKALSHAEAAAVAAQQESARHQAYIDDLLRLESRGVSVDSEVAQARRKALQARAKLDEATNDFERGKREAVHRLAQAMAEVNKAESEARNTLASIELTRAELGKATLRAPAPGFVVVHEIATGEQKRRLRVGDTVWQGQPILHLPDLSAMTVRARVREEDLHKIREGQEATIRVDAYPDAAFRGRVTSIGALALESPTAAGKHFQMGVALEGRDERLRPGMTARVSIVADHPKDVLVVPVPAIHYAGEQTICYVIAENGITARPVRVGRRGDDVVEIIAGLAEGDRVSLARP
jgi:HlyD family secretion protein